MFEVAELEHEVRNIDADEQKRKIHARRRDESQTVQNNRRRLPQQGMTKGL